MIIASYTYPTLTEFFREVFGVYIPLPIQTYGFLIAIAFLTAAYVVQRELKRKEKIGQLASRTIKVKTGLPPTISELVITTITSGFIGWKLVGIIFNYSEMVASPQDYIMSNQGSVIGGIIVGIAAGAYRYYTKKKQETEKPVIKDVEVHPYQYTTNILLLAVIFGLLGAKVFELLQPSNLKNFSWEMLFSFSGLTFFGGFIGGAVAVFIYINKKGLDWRHIIDTAAPAIMVAYCIGRLGCHFSGDGCWGVPANPQPDNLSWIPAWLWSYDYPHNVIHEGVHIHNCSGNYCTVLDQPVHPTSVYESMMAFLWFVILWSVRKLIKAPGVLFSIFLIMLGTSRFFIEFIRVTDRYSMGLSQGQIISIVLVLLGAAGIVLFSMWYKKKEEQPTEETEKVEEKPNVHSASDDTSAGIDK